MVIYEVNLLISKNIYNSFKLWLNSHIEKMMKFLGFNKYKLFQVNNNEANFEICIHFYIKNAKFLENYLLNYSQQMRNEAINKFGSSFKVKRRILLELK